MITLKERGRILESNPWKGRFSPTSLDSSACLRYYYLSKVRGLSEKHLPVTLHFGSAMHHAIGVFWTMRSMPANEAIRLFGAGTTFETEDVHEIQKVLAAKAFSQAWKSCDTCPDAKRNLMTGLQIIVKYCEYYKDDSSNYVPELIECPQWIEMPNGTMLGFIIDRLLREDNCVIVDDTKTTTSALTNWYFKDYKNGFQLSAYYYGVQQIIGICDQVRIDAVKIPWKDGDECFVRQSFMRTENQMKEFLNTYIRKTNYIMSALAEPPEKHLDLFYQEPKQCSCYNGCKFLPICTHGLDHPSIKIDFKERECDHVETRNRS